MSFFVHGDNILQKENHPSKYQDETSKIYLKEIRNNYERWKEENLKLIGPLKNITDKDKEIIEVRVMLFNKYKNFLDQQKYAEKFDSGLS